MGWGLILKNVYLLRVRKAELKEVSESCGRQIADARERLLIIAAAGAGMAAKGEGQEEWVSFIQREVSEAVEAVEEASVRRHLCEVALESPEDVEEDT